MVKICIDFLIVCIICRRTKTDQRHSFHVLLAHFRQFPYHLQCFDDVLHLHCIQCQIPPDVRRSHHMPRSHCITIYSTNRRRYVHSSTRGNKLIFGKQILWFSKGPKGLVEGASKKFESAEKWFRSRGIWDGRNEGWNRTLGDCESAKDYCFLWYQFWLRWMKDLKKQA